MATTTATDSPRIYVACLASYNNGVLHGEWIDATDADEMRTAVADLLRRSPFPNVTVDCPVDDIGAPGWDAESRTWAGGIACDVCGGIDAHGKVASAEEFAIHDHEGFAGIEIGEYESLDTVAELAQLIEEHGPAYAAYRGYVGADYATAEGFEDAYRGPWSTEEAFAEDLLDVMGELKDDSLASRYFNYEKFTRDLFMGDYWSSDNPDGGVFVFEAN